MAARVPAAKNMASFLRARGIGPTEAGRALGVTHVAVHQWLRSSCRPRPELREAIERWTGGAVPVADWVTARERTAAAKLATLQPFARTA